MYSFQTLRSLRATVGLRLPRRIRRKRSSTLTHVPASQVAIVYGGMHAAGIMKLLEEKGVHCTVVEPDGYRDDEAGLLARLNELIRVSVPSAFGM